MKKIRVLNIKPTKPEVNNQGRDQPLAPLGIVFNQVQPGLCVCKVGRVYLHLPLCGRAAQVRRLKPQVNRVLDKQIYHIAVIAFEDLLAYIFYGLQGCLREFIHALLQGLKGSVEQVFHVFNLPGVNYFTKALVEQAECVFMYGSQPPCFDNLDQACQSPVEALFGICLNLLDSLWKPPIRFYDISIAWQGEEFCQFNIWISPLIDPAKSLHESLKVLMRYILKKALRRNLTMRSFTFSNKPRCRVFLREPVLIRRPERPSKQAVQTGIIEFVFLQLRCCLPDTLDLIVAFRQNQELLIR